MLFPFDALFERITFAHLICCRDYFIVVINCPVKLKRYQRVEALTPITLLVCF